jgi:hypothetical protein
MGGKHSKKQVVIAKQKEKEEEEIKNKKIQLDNEVSTIFGITPGHTPYYPKLGIAPIQQEGMSPFYIKEK